MKTDFQDRIDEYLLDRMTYEEKAQFEAEINQDKSKKELLEFTRDVKCAINSRGDKMAKLRMMQIMYDREHHKVAASVQATGTDGRQYSLEPKYAEKKHSRRIWWWTSGVAAVLAIGLFVVYPFGSDTLQAPSGFSPSFKGLPIEMIRGEDNDVFDMGTPILNDSIKNDTIPSCDTVTVIEDVLNKSMTTKNAVRKPFGKIIIVIICVLVSISLPLIIQSPLNRLFRDLYNPSGWIVLQPHLRIICTLICFSITYGIGLCLLILAKSKRWLFVFHAILTFLWCALIAILLMP